MDGKEIEGHACEDEEVVDNVWSVSYEEQCGPIVHEKERGRPLAGETRKMHGVTTTVVHIVVGSLGIHDFFFISNSLISNSTEILQKNKQLSTDF